MTEPFAEGIVLPHGDGRRLSLTSKPVGTGQYLLTMTGEPVAAFVFASARDDARRAADEIAERLSVDHGVPAYMAINRFSLLDFARGVHAMLEKAERDCAKSEYVVMIHTWNDLLGAVEDEIRLYEAYHLLDQVLDVETEDLRALITQRRTALTKAIIAFKEAHRTESLADGFPMVEIPITMQTTEE